MTPSSKNANMGDAPVPLFENMPSENRSTIELLTIPEAAKFLRISASGMRRLQQQRIVPFIKVGGGIRFERSDLVAYLKRMREEALG